MRIDGENPSLVQEQTNGNANGVANGNGNIDMKIRLQANDGTIVEIDSDVAFKSTLIKDMTRNLGVELNDVRLREPLPVTNVNGAVLKKIMSYCAKYRADTYTPKSETEDPRVDLNQWDSEFLKVDNDELMAILMGANYLDIPGLIDIVTQSIANMTDGKSVEELREFFGIENDFTPEEEEEIRQRFEWVEQ